MTNMNENQVRQIFKEEIARFLKTDRYLFDLKLQILDARNIQIGKTSGTKIGTEATQKIAFYGVTPVVQASAIAGPAGGTTIDSQARTAINDIIAKIKAFGITA